MQSISSPCVTTDPGVFAYRFAPYNFDYGLWPLEYKGWYAEDMARGTTGNLSVLCQGGASMPITKVSGPQAREFLSKYLSNNMSGLKPGMQRRLLALSAKGNVILDGVLLCTAEDEFLAYASPDTYLKYREVEEKAAGELTQFELETITDDTYVFQLSGPNARAVVEEVAGEDVGDIEFLRFRYATIAGHRVRILNFGMGGSGSYEVHGEMAYGHEVYDAIVAVCEHHGVEKLGNTGYLAMIHTENGFAQMHIHFIYAFSDLADEEPKTEEGKQLLAQLVAFPSFWKCTGSCGANTEVGFRTPAGIGALRSVSRDHDYLGREAALAEKDAPSKTMVTLEWNAEDLGRVYESFFDPAKESPTFMELPYDRVNWYDGLHLKSDWVLDADGNRVGISSGRVFSPFYGRMISLATIDVDAAALGNELRVLHGEPDGVQVEIRATVARFPYSAKE